MFVHIERSRIPFLAFDRLRARAAKTIPFPSLVSETVRFVVLLF
jgi:hypothetical protein